MQLAIKEVREQNVAVLKVRICQNGTCPLKLRGQISAPKY